MTKGNELDFAADTIATVRAMWLDMQPVREIVAKTGLSQKSVQKIARLLPLPYHDPRILERIRVKRRLRADFHAVAAPVNDAPMYVTPTEARAFAEQAGTQWNGRRADLAVLNAEFARRGQRPVWVLGMPL